MFQDLSMFYWVLTFYHHFSLMVTGILGEPFALETIFGWALTGQVSVPDHNPITSLCLSVIDTLDTIIQFWVVEVVTFCKHLSRNKIITENIYKNTTTRLLYFKTPHPPFSDSKPFFFFCFATIQSS